MRSAGGEAPRLLVASGVVWIEDSRSMQCLRAGRKQEQTEEERGLEAEGRESRTLSTGNEDVRKEGNRRVGMTSLEWSLRFVPSRGARLSPLYFHIFLRSRWPQEDSLGTQRLQLRCLVARCGGRGCWVRQPGRWSICVNACCLSLS